MELRYKGTFNAVVLLEELAVVFPEWFGTWADGRRRALFTLESDTEHVLLRVPDSADVLKVEQAIKAHDARKSSESEVRAAADLAARRGLLADVQNATTVPAMRVALAAVVKRLLELET